MRATQSTGLRRKDGEAVASGFSHSAVSRSKARPCQLRRTTCIRFCVSVPVLSEQMTVAEPIVSHATSCRTRAFSRVMRRIARASDTVTLIGSPSGTATTMTMTMYMK